MDTEQINALREELRKQGVSEPGLLDTAVVTLLARCVEGKPLEEVVSEFLRREPGYLVNK